MLKLNEIEIFLILIQHMLEKKLTNNPSGGIKISDELKMKYSEMLRIHQDLTNFIEQSCSIGYYDICKNCESYLPDDESKRHGKCSNPKRLKVEKERVGQYHTCAMNTRTRFDGKKFDLPGIAKGGNTNG